MGDDNGEAGKDAATIPLLTPYKMGRFQLSHRSVASMPSKAVPSSITILPDAMQHLTHVVHAEWLLLP